MNRLLCRLFGHRLRMAEFDPITITHAWHCGDRCGLHGWPSWDGLTPHDPKWEMSVGTWQIPEGQP